MSSDNQTPDLASVMKILAGLTQARDQQQARGQQQTQPSTQIASAQIPEIKSHGLATQHQQQQQWPPYVTPPVVYPGQSQVVNNSKVVDPATIIDWSAGLRKAVGGATSSGASNTSPEELAQELETFDMKVYRAQTQMVREMNGKLRNLGVPFFGTKSELVRITGKAIATNGTGTNATEGEKAMIDEDELVELQRRMLNILEDLCND
ncbi:hypothetical protein SS1G_12932 [Sclerotinia sclerotiorum 1980 UF-70]|uniref:Uncharacterized protein n=1 Tax=Sclerotinia sclerotiorum (strain ATCC 18683 / 1980 / Ss-1) TaxID=665079 RepID=A7F5Q4_SCLS1|nr:hypothetical protein SS1G_12932 [Sclerotinia sclerotiorum 1980 UF-70]EDN98075.1 hypothetical protein SS1G_12932 [Sclerotinia sclerotiorum 1980 UF-70]